MKFLQEVKSPWIAQFTLEKLVGGKWTTFVLNRKYADLCPTLQIPTEPLHPFFSQFKKKECPFPAGHVETFENAEVLPIPEKTPSDFQGKFRLHLEFTYMNGLKNHVDCLNNYADVVEF